MTVHIAAGEDLDVFDYWDGAWVPSTNIPGVLSRFRTIYMDVYVRVALVLLAAAVLGMLRWRWSLTLTKNVVVTRILCIVTSLPNP